MEREFASTKVFDKLWGELGLTDDDMRKLETQIIETLPPRDIIIGTGGAAKTRYALHGKGKSGGARVIYTDVKHKKTTYLLLCYPKDEQEDLTSEQKKQLKTLIKTLKGE